MVTATFPEVLSGTPLLLGTGVAPRMRVVGAAGVAARVVGAEGVAARVLGAGVVARAVCPPEAWLLILVSLLSNLLSQGAGGGSRLHLCQNS